MAGPDILDDPPVEVAAELVALTAELDRVIPAKVLDRNFLLGTWNIRYFKDAINLWSQAEVRRRGPKDLHALRCVAEIISRFDVIAIQEVMGGAGALREVMRVLGPHWSVVLTDVNQGPVGNNERLALLFDTRTVLPSGLACELVMSEDYLERTGARQFARSPYAVGFRIRGGGSITVVTMHAYYGSHFGDKLERRLSEITAFAEWLRKWAYTGGEWAQNVVAAGDFNVVAAGDTTHQALTSTGLQIPEDLLGVRQQVRVGGSGNRQYQLMAWFVEEDGSDCLPVRYLRGGSFDYTGIALADRGLESWQYSSAMSDHLPLWAEFSLRG